MEMGNNDRAGLSRPLDVLGNASGKRVIVHLKSKDKVMGVLKAFDSHINLWLDDAEVQSEDSNVKIGTVLVRGDSIVWVSPAK
ncbi:MAG: RNA-binding protein [Candidatus Micrarchaeota archaeon]|nr:RNA-binding protein [Candidatus Micrarchaeota archaeon]